MTRVALVLFGHRFIVLLLAVVFLSIRFQSQGVSGVGLEKYSDGIKRAFVSTAVVNRVDKAVKRGLIGSQNMNLSPTTGWRPPLEQLPLWIPCGLP